MVDIEADLPEWLRQVRYDGSCIPPIQAQTFDAANCQVFAYAVLGHFGRVVPPLRSSELWVDAAGQTVDWPFAPLDLLFFNSSRDAFGAHLAVSLGGQHALHLCKIIGRPAVWTLDQFAAEPRYCILLGGRRFAP